MREKNWDELGKLGREKETWMSWIICRDERKNWDELGKLG